MSHNAALPYETGHRVLTITAGFPGKGTFSEFTEKFLYRRAALRARPPTWGAGPSAPATSGAGRGWIDPAADISRA